jgi:hypothetical protein
VEGIYYCTYLQKGEKKLTVVITEKYHCYQLHTKIYRIFAWQG